MKSGKRRKTEADSNALIMPCNAKSKHKAKIKVTDKAKKISCNLSKNQQRKLRRIQEEKEKQAKRAAALEILEKNKLTEEAQALLHTSGTIGQVATKRTKLSRALLFHRAGLEVPSDVQLFRERKMKPFIPESELCTDEASNSENNSIRNTGMSDNLESFSRQQINSGKTIAKMPSKGLMNVNDCNTKVTLGTACFDSTSVSSKELDADAKSRNEKTKCQIVSQAIVNTVVQKGMPENNSTFQHASSCQDCPGTNHNVDATINKKKNKKSKKNIQNQVLKGSDTTLTSEVPSLRHTFFVPVSRPEKVTKQRSNLPIVMMEQEIMEAISHNSVVIICGATGCGKTTQVPQFLFEAGFGSSTCKERAGMIGVTQPRRVAVLATAKRITYEMSFTLGKEVGFQVRHDRQVGKSSSIKFMTDGILLREIQSDFLLRRYSIIVLDEAHERSLNTDILIGMLSRIVPLRQNLHDEQQKKISNGESVGSELIFPLKLVLMSATLKIEDFVLNTKLFPTNPPVIEVPVRQFPVTIHFSAKTELVDYLGKAYKKVLAIHTKLPAGGILVFVTGQREVEFLCKRLRKAFLKGKENAAKMIKESQPSDFSSGLENAVCEADPDELTKAMDSANDNVQSQYGTDRYELYDDDGFDVPEETESSSSDLSSDSDSDGEEECYDVDTSFPGLEKTLEQSNIFKKPENMLSLQAAFETLTGEGNNIKAKIESADAVFGSLKAEQQTEADSSRSKNPGPLHVLPLYAMLPAAAQLRVFSEVPNGERLVVVATNVAETSITIPGIKYVVDCGRAKVKEHNGTSGIAKYEIQWISKASAAQRAGRAGRTGPGHCYRLYSSAVFNTTFSDFPVPEILKVPIDGVLLVLKHMGIDKVINFPFPTPPDMSALIEGERCLKSLSAINQSTGKLTPLGSAMALYPISPRHSCMLLTIIQIIKGLIKCSQPNLILSLAIGAAAALSTDSPFLMDFGASASKESDKEADEKEDSKRKQHSIAKNAHKKFENMNSDVLTIVNALHEFEFAENQTEFCNMNFIHFKTMDEMSKLRKQLLFLVFQQKFDKEHEQFTWPYGSMKEMELSWRDYLRTSLLQTQEVVIREAICAGWIDRVARRVRSNMVSKMSQEGQKLRAIKYQACSTEEIIFLRSSSFLGRTAPEFAVYNELIHTKRLYMQGVTAVDRSWLVQYGRTLCTFSKPLADPPPAYDSLSDQVFCWVSPSFGPHLWDLSLHKSSIKSKKQRAAVFACALLQGKVLPCLKTVQNFLAADPMILLKPEAVVHKRVADILYKLNSASAVVDSRTKLKNALDQDPKFLYSELLSWIQKNAHSKFDDLWEMVKYEVSLEHKQLYPKKRKKLPIEGDD